MAKEMGGNIFVTLYRSKIDGDWSEGILAKLEGSQGEQGLARLDGNGIVSGMGVPAATAVNNGDFYIDLQTYDMYVPNQER